MQPILVASTFHRVDILQNQEKSKMLTQLMKWPLLYGKQANRIFN